CYDYPSASIVADSKLDCVLVGDSLAMVVHGHENTLMATVEMMALHTEAVARGIKQQFIITDLPFLAHKASLSETVSNVKTLLRAGAMAIKIEGGDEDTCKTIAHLCTAGVPIMGHIGLTPQAILQIGGFKAQGKDKEAAQNLLKQAKMLEKAGCFALVIECVPEALAKQITESINIPTIGIGAGKETSGQVLVWHDFLGIQQELNLRFVKKYSNLKELKLNAINNYVSEVKNTHFPAAEHSF
ncbi:MAG: 3-methyl-2-oxobutanoate hydroxymethyltransferase, partial [Proteobacteria bacterium]|nr:3-methyl-2-oxobutanoate hydroxymethyltransferase [Pseudomonadota bacterium]